jgi:hypothetical protein
LDTENAKAATAQSQTSTVHKIEAASASGPCAFDSPITKPSDVFSPSFIGVAEWQIGRAILRTE